MRGLGPFPTVLTHLSFMYILGQWRECHELSNVPADYPSQGTRTRGACGDLHHQTPACTGQHDCHLLMLSWQSVVFPVVCMCFWSLGNQAMHEDLMEQKYVGSAEFNLAEAVYARSSPKNHGWLKKKLENIKRPRNGMDCRFSRDWQWEKLSASPHHW